MNISEKILAKSSGREKVEPGEIVEATVNKIMVNEITGPLAIQAFKNIGMPKVWDAKKIILVLDHQVPADSVKSAELHKIMRNFAGEQNIHFLYDIGSGGVCHQIMVEKGHVNPGQLIVGADSHTCTYGALGAFATGIGSTEAAAVFATGKIWLRVPPSIKIIVNGTFKKFVAPKDLILQIIGQVGVDGAIYKAVEYTGSTIKNMSISGRLTLCNMSVEMGAKTGIINPDDTTSSFIKAKPKKGKKILRSDLDASFEKTLQIEVDTLEPQVACPNSVGNVNSVKNVEGIEIDQAFLGSCTNGRLEDIELAANMLRNKKVKKGVRFLITPASQEIYLKIAQKGLLEVLVKSGAYVCSPTCGACFGGHMGLLAAGEICISSSNRNFVGRMGSPEAKIYLASPATVTASALAGKIVDPNNFFEGYK
jgi:3-isopropylmalate/(R)-2-methylmalate dehydratase large subunit